MSKQTLAQDSRRATRQERASQAQETTPSPMTELAAAMMGVPWLNLWADAWTAWLQQCEANMSALQAGDAESADRRQNGASWLPQFESKVIPFRRSDDKPGVEATKLSMRFRMPSFPWMVGSNIIAIDTVMPRPVEPSDERFRKPEK